MESSPYNSLLTLLDTRANLNDPRDSTNVHSRTFIYDADPFWVAIDFRLMPYIVFELPTMSNDNISVDGTTNKVLWTHKITIRTARDWSSNSRTDQGRTDMLSIGNQLQVFFNSNAIKQQLYNLGLSNFKLTKLLADVGVADGKYYYQAEYQLSYNTRIEVTA